MTDRVFTYAVQVAEVDEPEKRAWRMIWFQSQNDAGALGDELAECGFIQGDRLILAKRKNGESYVKRRMQGVVFTKQAIHSISPASEPGVSGRGSAA